MQNEQEFFHFIAAAVQDLVNSRSKKITIAKMKRDGDFATEVDVAVENRIVEEIKKRFPDDKILAEENNKDSVITDERIWIIDPICGTNNLARGIKNFCTNIALSENNKLVAACVIDYGQNAYYWSIGEGKVYSNDVLIELEERYDTYIEVDFGAITSVGNDIKEKHNRMLKRLVTEENYYLISLNSSLGFVYAAIGKVDGVVNVFHNPWDACAASFLIQQSGGIVTNLQGETWTPLSGGMIAANKVDLHKKLVEFYNN